MTLPDLYEIAEAQGIDIDYFPMNEVVSASFAEGFVAIDTDKLSDSREEKSILAHELGHIETGSFYNIYTPLDVLEKHEHRADKWAINKLIPKNELLNVLRCGFTELWELAEYFEVPCEFMKKATDYYSADLANLAVLK